MHVDIPTLTMVAAITSAALALALAVSLRTDIAYLGASLRIWAVGIAIQALGWLLVGLRGTLPDAIAIVAANVVVVIGFAECVRALRSFGGRRAQVLPYVPALLVLISSIVFTYIVPSRDLRMLTNSAFLALLLGQSSREVLRIEGGARERPRSHWLVAGTFALGGIVLLGRVIWIAFAGAAPVVSMTVLVIYACAALGPVVASLGFALMCTDRLDRELVLLATVDPLTGVHNRRSLESLAHREITLAHRHGHGHGLVLLLIDVDHFKRVNDELGHAAGDEVLRAVTATLRAAMREGDILSRLGGDEFVVLMPHADGDAGGLAAERLRASVAVTPPPSPPFSLTVSIGLAQWIEGEHLDDLLRRADRALYRAKECGRNRVGLAQPGSEELPISGVR
jgi:diguanylate cyclase (GGDEF) domain